MTQKSTYRGSFEDFVADREAELAKKLKRSVEDSNELVDRYERAVSIKHREMYIRRFSGVWFRQKKDGRFKEFCRAHTLMHLLGCGLFGVFRLRRSSVLLIDLDAKDPEGRASLRRRYRSVRKAFGGVECLVLRSSDSPTSGLHLYYFLRGRHRSGVLYRRATKTLAERGVKVGPGRVEVFPNPKQGARLPLGSGSLLLDPGTLQPIASALKKGEPVLDLARAVPYFLESAERIATTAHRLLGESQ